MSEASDFQSIILRNLLFNEAYSRQVVPHLKKKYFEGTHKIIFSVILNFILKYNKLPSRESLKIDLENSELLKNVVDVSELELIYNEIIVDNDDNDLAWLIDETEKYIQDRAIYLAIMESIEIIEGRHETLTKNVLPELLSDAIAVSFDSRIGHSYLNDAESRFEFYNRKEERVPFDLDYMNRITNNGLSKKSMMVLISGTNAGKTLAMCHFAASTLAQGKNVLYITMEMAEERIAERIDANLMNISINDVHSIDKKQFISKINAIQTKTTGDLIIQEYPTGSGHVGHFRALLHELKLKRKFIPDMIIIDYLNICASSRVKNLGSNSYNYIKAVAEELRGLAVEQNVPIITASQVNRSGQYNSDVDLTNVSESTGTSATADIVLALIRTEELDKLNQIMFKQLKNRFSDPSKYRRFVLGVDREKMRLYDVENSAQSGINIEGGPHDAPEELLATSKKYDKNKFSKFKVGVEN